MPEERKLVTILFADVTGSTALADTLDPEDVRALMSRYYNHARRVITPRGGTLEKFIGDAVMAIFGLYQAHEDDPERGMLWSPKFVGVTRFLKRNETGEIGPDQAATRAGRASSQLF